MISTTIGQKLPQPLLELCQNKLGDADMGAVLHTLTGNELMVLLKIDSPAPTELKELGDEFTVTLFIAGYVPFLVFTYKTFYFELPITDPSLIAHRNNTAFLYAVDENYRVLHSSVLGLPVWMIEKIYNVLNNGPYKSIEERNKQGSKIMELVGTLEMIRLGKSYRMRGANAVSSVAT